MKSIFLLLPLALVSLSTHAALNKWVDAEGKVHYSDTVPPEASAAQSVRNISGKGQGEASASYSPKSVAEREAERRKAKQTKEEAANKTAGENAQAEAKSRNCEAARQNVQTLEDGMRIVTYDSKGERGYMDDETRAKKLDEARQAVSNNCN